MCAFFFKNVTKDNIYELLFNNCLLGVVTSGGWYSTVLGVVTMGEIELVQ